VGRFLAPEKPSTDDPVLARRLQPAAGEVLWPATRSSRTSNGRIARMYADRGMNSLAQVSFPNRTYCRNEARIWSCGEAILHFVIPSDSYSFPLSRDLSWVGDRFPD
jgi:hypothetical protein